jgi:hypothetical protein
MTNMIANQLDSEIAKARKQAAARIAKLKRAAAAEQERIDSKVIGLLREQQPDLYDQLARRAAGAVETAKAARAARASRMAPTTQQIEPTPAPRDGADAGEGARQ